MILMGYGYARLRSIDINAINQLNMEVLTPTLLFSVLSEKSFHFSLSRIGFGWDGNHIGFWNPLMAHRPGFRTR